MNVSIAAQTLRSSVADAIEFLNKAMHLQQFGGSESMVDFIRLIDRLFDILNSRNPFGKGFKQPLRLCTEHRWSSILKSSAEYLLSLKAPNGQPL